MTIILVVAQKSGAKRLKALLKATMSLVRFVFEDSTVCVIDHWLEGLSSVTVKVSPHQGFRRMHPAFPRIVCIVKVLRPGLC